MDDPRAGFDQLLAELRPKLHRYCFAHDSARSSTARDVLQEALVKAIEAFPRRPDRQAGGLAVPHRPQRGARLRRRARQRMSVPTRIST
jgi:hypothetical protein